MKIAAATFDGCRGLADRAYPLSDPSSGRAHDLVVVTGPPASGKTTFLDALVAAKEIVAPYGARQLNSQAFVRRNSASAKVTVSWDLSPAEVDRTQLAPRVDTESIFGARAIDPGSAELALLGILGRYSRAPNVGKFEYFHADRRLPTSVFGAQGNLEPQGSERFVRLAKEAGKYAFVPRYLAEMSTGVGLDAMREAFSKVCSTKTFAGAHHVDGALAPHFFDRRSDWTSVWSDLTGSERQGLLFAATFLWAGLNDSVVFIDAPERDIGERHVVDFVRGLASLGADNQLIVATGFRALVEAVHPSAVVVLE